MYKSNFMEVQQKQYFGEYKSNKGCLLDVLMDGARIKGNFIQIFITNSIDIIKIPHNL